MTAGLEYRGTGDRLDIPGVLWREVAKARVQRRRARLGLESREVVVVDDAELGDTLVNVGHQRLVVRHDVGARICLQALEPGERLLVAVPGFNRAHDRPEA